MSNFRARLCIPKRTLWLGVTIASVEMKRSQASGRPYALVRFKETPLISHWHEFHHLAFQHVLLEREICPPAQEIVPGLIVHLDVSWVTEPYPLDGSAKVYPRPVINIDSVLEHY